METSALPGVKSRGDVLRASEVNQVTDAIRAAQRAVNQIGGSGRPIGTRNEPAAIVSILNDTGATIERGTIWGLAETYNADDPTIRVFKIETPDASHLGRWVVAAMDILNGTVGPAYFSGICQVVVNVADEDAEDYRYADIDQTEGSGAFGSEKLVACGDGSAEILWKESGTGDVQAIIRFPRIRQGKMAKLKAAIDKDAIGSVKLCTYNTDTEEYDEYGIEFDALNVGPSNGIEGDIVLISEDEHRRPFFLR